MRIPVARTLVAIATLGALAGCGKQESKAPKGSSFVEVLPGSASDAMPPYDTVSSAPPLAAPEPETKASAGGKQNEGEDSAPSSAAPEADAT